MLWYVIRRIAVLPIMLLTTCLIIFFLVNLSPVDPAPIILGTGQTPEAVEALHEEMGLDRPIIVQFGNYLVDALHGDFGNSWYTQKAVIDEIADRWPVTAQLAIYTTLVAMIIGIPLGIICAVKQYSIMDSTLNAICMCLSSMPAFWISLMLLLLFSMNLGWLPAYGLGTFKHWILPVTTLSLPYIAMFLRMTRSSMLDCIRQDYVRTARSKGHTEGTVIYVHALRNALLPLVTICGQTIASLMGGALVVEQVFSLPGLGALTIDSIQKKDVPMITGSVLFIAIFFLIITLAIDLIYAVVDPRVKATYASQSVSSRVKVKKEKGAA